MENVLKVDEYLFLYKEGSLNSKKLKRKFTKKKMLHLLNTVFYKDDFNKESIQFLLNYLKDVKRRNSKKEELKCIGFLSDDNIILDEIFILPSSPEKWDILFLECEINEYCHNDKYNTVYWRGLKSINDSRNFVINVKSIDRIISFLLKCKTWNDFASNVSNLDHTYTIVKSFFSEREKDHVYFQKDVYNSKKTSQQERDKLVNEYNQKVSHKLEEMDVSFVNYNYLVNTYNEKIVDLSYEEQYMMLPSISLICIMSNVDKFIHALYTFLKLDYPRDKLELILVDDNDYEKKIKGYLPEDGRIKIINITKKNQDKENMKIPMGNKINMGIKYASYNLIFHYFDTNIYLPEKFKDLVKCYIVSNKDALMSGDTGFFCKNESMFLKKVDLGNMLYTKAFWSACSFIDVEDHRDILVYNFIYFRRACIAYIPFLYYSFIYAKDSDTKNGKFLPFSLEKIVNERIKESFLLIG